MADELVVGRQGDGSVVGNLVMVVGVDGRHGDVNDAVVLENQCVMFFDPTKLLNSLRSASLLVELKRDLFNRPRSNY